eukprot:scaffold12344_cov70-Skeletonema_marinoi.AAC.1
MRYGNANYCWRAMVVIESCAMRTTWLLAVLRSQFLSDIKDAWLLTNLGNMSLRRSSVITDSRSGPGPALDGHFHVIHASHHVYLPSRSSIRSRNNAIEQPH